jgi:DNA-binding CsgD family transcriptional regulator
MSRREISVGTAEDVMRLGERETPHFRRNGEYAVHPLDMSAYGPLLMSEIRRAARIAGLTELQTVVWQWHAVGVSFSAIAEKLGRSKPTIRQHFNAAEKKIRANVKHLGLLTCLIECQGIDAVKDHFGSN